MIDLNMWVFFEFGTVLPESKTNQFDVEDFSDSLERFRADNTSVHKVGNRSINYIIYRFDFSLEIQKFVSLSLELWEWRNVIYNRH